MNASQIAEPTSRMLSCFRAQGEEWSHLDAQPCVIEAVAPFMTTELRQTEEIRRRGTEKGACAPFGLRGTTGRRARRRAGRERRRETGEMVVATTRSSCRMDHVTVDPAGHPGHWTPRSRVAMVAGLRQSPGQRQAGCTESSVVLAVPDSRSAATPAGGARPRARLFRAEKFAAMELGSPVQRVGHSGPRYELLFAFAAADFAVSLYDGTERAEHLQSFVF
ncbi:hypothetical protein ABZP36_030214 [Zizania latifolia]